MFKISEMDAVLVEEGGKVGLVRVAVPVVGPEEALVRVCAVGICGTDVEICHGTMGYYTQGETIPLTLRATVLRWPSSLPPFPPSCRWGQGKAKYPIIPGPHTPQLLTTPRGLTFFWLTGRT